MLSGRIATLAFVSLSTSASWPRGSAGAQESASIHVGVVASASSGKILPALSFGPEIAVESAFRGAYAVRLGASALAPVSYSGEAICLETTSGINCADRSQHVSQMFSAHVLGLRRIGTSDSAIFAFAGVGAYSANPAVHNGGAHGESGWSAAAGVAANHLGGPVRGVEAQVTTYGALFGGRQWAAGLRAWLY